MKIGSLNNELKGKIAILEASINLRLAANKDRKDDKGPTHIVEALNRFGDYFQIGSAWERKISKGEKINQNMYSLAIDDPAFKTPLNCTAFPTSDGFYISWERQE